MTVFCITVVHTTRGKMEKDRHIPMTLKKLHTQRASPQDTLPPSHLF